jgi:hypothetical protein
MERRLDRYTSKRKDPEGGKRGITRALKMPAGDLVLVRGNIREYCHDQMKQLIRTKWTSRGWRAYDVLMMAGGPNGTGQIDPYIESWFPGPRLREEAIAVALETIMACEPHKEAVGFMPTTDKPMFCWKCAVPMREAYVATIV